MSKLFRTSDIVLASTLKINNFNLVKIEIDRNKGVFVFDDIEDEFIQDFDLGKVLVEPIEFNNGIKSLTTATRRLLK